MYRMEKPKEKPPEFFKSTKISLKGILKDPEINTTKINNPKKNNRELISDTPMNH